MPDDYYVSQYSGEEIDAMLGGAGEGTVRYDAAQTITDAQKTQARENIAAAPSGGGVMERAPKVEASSDSESYDTFCAKMDAVLATMPDESVKFLYVYPPQFYGFGHDMCALVKNSNDYASVYTIGSYNYGRQGFRMIKRKRYGSAPAGQWDPLEYINPEMTLGVEYRTTERWNGKPVYVIAFDYGPLPNNTVTSTTIPEWVSTNRAFSVNVIAHSPSETCPVPLGLSSDYSSSFWFIQGKTFYIKSRADLSGYTSCYVYIKYTKE